MLKYKHKNKKREKYLREWEQEKLFSIHYFLEVFKGKLVRSFMEFFTGVSVGKVPDPQTVGRVELAHQKLAAGLSHRGHLQD